MSRLDLQETIRSFKPGIVTRAISAFAPIHGERRAASEYRAHIRSQLIRDAILPDGKKRSAFGSYDAASDSRLRDGWSPTNGSPDFATLSELEKMRARSADLVRNNPFANSILQTYQVNIVSTGIQAQPSIDYERVGMSEDKVRSLNEDAQSVFETWADNPDYSDRYVWLEMQELIVRGMCEMGDIFAIPRTQKYKRTAFDYRVQLIEADRVRTPFVTANRLKEECRDGIVIDPESGEPLAIWVSNKYKQDYVSAGYGGIKSDKYQRIPYYDSSNRRNVLHLSGAVRPGLSRGVPMFHASMTLFDDLSKYLEAELTAARVAACFSVFIKKLDPYGAAGGNLYSSTTERLESVEPGMIEYLDPGEDISSFSPQRPSATFEGFVSRLLKTIASACGVPYELVAKDFSGVNYSSARIALLQSYRHFRTIQRWLVLKFLQPVYERVMEEAYLKGMWGADIPLAQFNALKRDFMRVQWIAPGWEWVDPLKESQAQALALDKNITTLSDLSAAMGRNWQDTLEQRAREKNLERKLGIEVQSDVTGTQGGTRKGSKSEGGETSETGAEAGD